MKRLSVAIVLTAVICSSFHSSSVIIQQTTVTTLSTDTIILPATYTTRKFITSISGSDYDAATLPGNIVKYDSSSSIYEIETMTAIIKGNKPAIATKLDNGTIFSGTIPSSSNLNGSPMINGITMEKNQAMDLEIKDDATYSVPDGQIDTAAIRSATQAVPVVERKNMFYITSATVSIISYKVHAGETALSKLSSKIERLTKQDTVKKGISIQSKSKSKPPSLPFSSSESKTVTDKVISVQLTPVNDFLKAAGKK
ncbi:MAG TPA: hypothetical protein VFE54_04120 [Mucilaginibacter sp.]|jgi:hypothetical protein|nr:hypothetical protein [Mucilaginibacter sp.]